MTSVLTSHPRRALLAVLLFVVIAGVLGGPVAGALSSDGGFTPPGADSAVALDRIAAATGREAAPGIAVLVRSDDPARVRAVSRELAAVPGLVEVTDAGSRVGTTLLTATVLDAADDGDVVDAVVDRFHGRDDVVVGGSLVAGAQVGDAVGTDLGRAELLALPLLVLLSLLIFGGRAALIPLGVGVTTVLGTFLALSVVDHAYGLSIFALNLVIGLGLGLSVDYSLFLLTRYREEVARQGVPGAITTTMATAGRTVVFSAATVAVALATLVLFPLGFLKSMGIAGAVVAVVAALAALVICPAVFALWGEKLVRHPRRVRPESEGRWYRLSHAVMRRPGTIAAVTGLVMLVLALPALRATWTPIDGSVVPRDQSARTVSDAIDRDFSTATSPVIIALRAGPDQGAVVASYAEKVAALPGVAETGRPVDLGHDTWQLDVTARGDASGDDAQHLVRALHDLDPGADVGAQVAGPAAEFVDQQDAIGARLPLAVGLLVLLTLLVLWLMTGSVVLPVKAVVMNALTVGTALGALTFVYQDGRLTGLLGYTPNGGIEPTDFLVAAALVFALSTDYGVFLLGRIREARESGVGEREAVAVGLQRTGGVVTAAAVLLAVAIGAFSTSSISFIQQIGVATATGVLVDAFVVRSLLVPALMGLLGRWNWWAPAALQRLHARLEVAD